MMKNAYLGEYRVEELTKNVELIESVRMNPRFASAIQEAEKEAGFKFEDFKLNLAVSNCSVSIIISVLLL